ncbi:ribosomal RNA small subunit methyltransferase J [Thiosulfatimonas sediminis]|uniref:Ribosomal RNA small subunit methyltransferase J n=1 Tax=Thiosulfatimonas sediminis TaxID=2675054 RepID=A0A6F8PWU6_9GAMM|nr:class I SAM-dependent methyltransferase [Thiosulfatimonas sediminis]BBP46566.1 ribosomal RNA small subunit methyltransferase J [Thiosulfatimonas sediminis]
MQVFIDDRTFSQQAQQLAIDLALPRLSDGGFQVQEDALLSWSAPKKSTHLHLALLPPDSGPLSIDFFGGKKAHRRQFGGGKGQPLVRAMGHLTDRMPTIFDATAGMGGDAFVLASLGFTVWMNERNPVVAALLQDALQRAKVSQERSEIDVQSAQIISRLSFSQGDSVQIIRELAAQGTHFDTIYLDPMYPHKKKSAATKKEMATLQKLLGADIDSALLLENALQHAKYRVVVKRPKGAEPIAYAIKPSSAIESPNTRYDVYSIKALTTG